MSEVCSYKKTEILQIFLPSKAVHPLEQAQCKTVLSQTQASAGVPFNHQCDTCASVTDHSFHSRLTTRDKKQEKYHKCNSLFYCKGHDATVSTVENAGFKSLIEVLNSRYQLPGRKHFFQTAISQLYA